MTKQVVLPEDPTQVASILDGSVLQAYNDSIQKYNERARETLGKLNHAGVELTGSSPFMLVHLVNSGALPEDVRLATRADLEVTTSKCGDFLSGNYVDFGLALKTAGDSYKPNDLPAKVIAKDLEKRGVEIRSGKLIPFAVLKPEEHDNSAYGVVFKLNDGATKDSVLDLGQFEWDYTRDDGLSCAHFDSNRNWNSDGRGLAGSGGYGKVVVVSGGATAQKILDRHISEFRKERDAELARIEKEYHEREARLRIK